MKPNFTYFSTDGLAIDSFNKALDVVRSEKMIIDSDYLFALEAAERGNLPAVCEMATLFCVGAHGLPRNYNIARIYIDALKDYNQDHPEAYINALYNSGILEYSFNNFSTAMPEFIKAAKHMVIHLPLEQWTFEVFDYIEQISLKQR